MNMVKPIYGCIEKVEKEWVSVLFSDSQKSFTIAPLLSSWKFSIIFSIFYNFLANSGILIKNF